jgi:hypothetical protein
MNLRFFTFGALLVSSFSSHAMNETKETIKIAKADVLRSRLKMVAPFIHKVDIVTQLAEQEKTPKEVAQAVDKAIEAYYKHLDTKSDPMSRELEGMMRQNRKQIFKAFLQDHPEAFKKLEKEGF